MQILNHQQGSPEWIKARLGIPTASKFGAVLAGSSGKESKTRRGYMLDLAGEILTGDPMYSYTNEHMERGKGQEAEARALYALVTGSKPEKVGFILSDDGKTGCSPDSLIGKNGALEIKSALPRILFEHLLAGELPSEHKPQAQGILWITEREWIDLAVYSSARLPLFKLRIARDEEYIKALALAVSVFNHELDSAVEEIRRIGAPAAKGAKRKGK